MSYLLCTVARSTHIVHSVITKRTEAELATVSGCMLAYQTRLSCFMHNVSSSYFDATDSSTVGASKPECDTHTHTQSHTRKTTAIPSRACTLRVNERHQGANPQHIAIHYCCARWLTALEFSKKMNMIKHSDASICKPSCISCKV